MWCDREYAGELSDEILILSSAKMKSNQLEKIVRRIRDNTVGQNGYSAIDFLEDVKCACACEGIQFDDDIFNELVG
jgi:hypothetical protein